MIDRLCVIGVGLIGGSLARALRRAGVVGEVVGCGRSEGNMLEAVELGVIDSYAHEPAVAVEGADMVVLATNLGATAAVLEDLAPALGPDCVVTDVGSVKGAVVEAARATLGAGARRFVAGHPIAGTERSGVAASFAELFEGHRVILTPDPDTDADAVAAVEAMWRSAGAVVTCMDAAHHDRVLAATSHLPHLLAYTLVDSLASLDESGEIFEYAAGGFRDFTRIASSSPEMWADITLQNRAALLEICAHFEGAFAALQVAIRAGDAATIGAVFARAKAARDAYQAPGRSA